MNKILKLLLLFSVFFYSCLTLYADCLQAVCKKKSNYNRCYMPSRPNFYIQDGKAIGFTSIALFPHVNDNPGTVFNDSTIDDAAIRYGREAWVLDINDNYKEIFHLYEVKDETDRDSSYLASAMFIDNDTIIYIGNRPLRATYLLGLYTYRLDMQKYSLTTGELLYHHIDAPIDTTIGATKTSGNGYMPILRTKDGYISLFSRSDYFYDLILLKYDKNGKRIAEPRLIDLWQYTHITADSTYIRDVYPCYNYPFLKDNHIYGSTMYESQHWRYDSGFYEYLLIENGVGFHKISIDGNLVWSTKIATDSSHMLARNPLKISCYDSINGNNIAYTINYEHYADKRDIKDSSKQYWAYAAVDLETGKIVEYNSFILPNNIRLSCLEKIDNSHLIFIATYPDSTKVFGKMNKYGQILILDKDTIVYPSNYKSYIRNMARGWTYLDNDLYIYEVNKTDSTAYNLYYEALELFKVDNFLLHSISEPLSLVSSTVYPNPTAAENMTTVRLELEDACDLRIVLSDVLGKEIMQVYEGFADAGTFTKSFTTQHLPKGVYFLKTLIGGQYKIEKIVVND